jgi:hypothetical protein
MAAYLGVLTNNADGLDVGRQSEVGIMPLQRAARVGRPVRRLAHAAYAEFPRRTD